MSIDFVDIGTNAFSIGPFAVKWYALAYLVGVLYSCFFLSKHLNLNKSQQDKLILYTVLGVVLGGRAGYVLFYALNYYLMHPVEIIQIWHGGMSFHGGFCGVVFASLLFSRKYKINFLYFLDLIACTASFGIFFARIANFINAELYGNITDLPWGVVFPTGGKLARHPTQIYEAILEGLLLFLIINALYFFTSAKKYKGLLAGVWVSLYGIFRIIVEFFRQPDEHIGYIKNCITMGQLLSLPLLIVGIFCILHPFGQKPNHKTQNDKR